MNPIKTIGFFIGIISQTNSKYLIIKQLHIAFLLWHPVWLTGYKHLIIFKMKNQAMSVYKKAQKFADITKTLIIKGNIRRAKKCLSIAENLLITGSSETKNAISNVYVYSVSSFMEIHNCSISNLFPTSLREEYLKQINTSGV